MAEHSKGKKIVILGAGFGGVRTALDLSKKLNGTSHRISLINKTDHTDYHADLYEIAGAFLQEPVNKTQKKLQFANLGGTVSIDLNRIFKNKNVDVLTTEVKDLDLKNRQLSTNVGKITYDCLVLAVGSETNYFGIPHLEEYSLPLKTVEDALNIRNEIDEIFLRNKGEDIRIVIGGGGFTGCELAGELPAYLEKLSKLHNHDKQKIKVTVIEACPNLLNGTQKWVQEKAKKRLERLDVELLLENKIVNVQPQNVILESGKQIPFDLLAWTAGIKPNSLVESISGVKLEKNNCLAVDKYLRLITFENVFAIGDNAYCFDYEHNCFVPPTAQLAIAQGKTAAKNIAAFLDDRGPEEFKPKLPNFIIPLGQNYALGQLFGLQLTGVAAWWLKRIVALKYLSSILPFGQALYLWERGNRAFTA